MPAFYFLRGPAGSCPPFARQAGDIVYIATRRQPPGRKIAPRASRVGVVFHDERGWMLAESAGAVCRYRPLRGAVAGSQDDWFVVRRLQRKLSGAELAGLRAACEKRRGQWHQLLLPEVVHGFRSRFVEQVYAEAGIDLPGADMSVELLRCTGHAAARGWVAGLLGAFKPAAAGASALRSQGSA